MEDVTLTQLKNEHEGKTNAAAKEPLVLIKDMLKDIYKQLQTYDSNSKMLSWCNHPKKGTMYMKIKDHKDMPDDPVYLTQFFDGLNLKRKSGRRYICFRFHSKKQNQVYAEMKNLLASSILALGNWFLF